jgi:hypothetical protein
VDVATKEQVLEDLKRLMASAADVSKQAAPANPFDQVSTTIPALENLKLNGQVISDEDLNKLLDEVEKAKSNDETWAKVAGTIGSLLGGLAKGILGILIAVVFVGCSTPPPIQRASKVEREAMLAFKDDHDKIVDALFAALEGEMEKQIQLIENYEVKIKGANLAQADVQTLMTQARKKREELGLAMQKYREKTKLADRNFEIALQIHDSIAGFLDRKAFDMNDVAGLVDTTLNLKDTLKK